MNKLKFFVIIALSALVVFGCGWSEDEKKEFQAKCAEGVSFFEFNSIDLYGFNKNEIDTIKMVELDSSSASDTIEIYTDSLGRNNYHISPSVKLKFGCTYHFYIDSVKHVVSDIEMVMHPTFTMFEENYECAFMFKTDGLEEFHSLEFHKDIFSK